MILTKHTGIITVDFSYLATFLLCDFRRLPAPIRMLTYAGHSKKFTISAIILIAYSASNIIGGFRFCLAVRGGEFWGDLGMLEREPEFLSHYRHELALEEQVTNRTRRKKWLTKAWRGCLKLPTY
jgi:hypothetical protein